MSPLVPSRAMASSMRRRASAARLGRRFEGRIFAKRSSARTGAPMIEVDAVAAWPWTDVKAEEEAEFEAVALTRAASPARPSPSPHGVVFHSTFAAAERALHRHAGDVL